MAGLSQYGLQVEDAKKRALEQAQRRTDYVKKLRQNRPDFSPELVNKFADTVAPMGANHIIQPKTTNTYNFSDESADLSKNNDEKNTSISSLTQGTPKLGLTNAANAGQGIVYQRGYSFNPEQHGQDIGQQLKRTDSAGISFAPQGVSYEQPQLGLVNINARPSQAEMEQRQKLIKQALTPIAGARGITANQMRIAQSLMEEPAKRQAELAKTQANINAGLQKTALEAQQAQQRQALEMARFGLQRQDMLDQRQREDDRQALLDARSDEERNQNNALFGLKKQALEMQNEQARLGLNKLQQAEDAQNEYDNAQTPDEQQKAYAKMKRLGLVAKEDKGTFQKTKVPIMDENGTPIGEREIFYNPNTGETRDPQGSGGLGLNPANRTVSNAADLADIDGNVQLRRGQVVNGRRYLGGNPYDEKNWEEV